jgi:hypothetical protein
MLYGFVRAYGLSRTVSSPRRLAAFGFTTGDVIRITASQSKLTGSGVHYAGLGLLCFEESVLDARAILAIISFCLALTGLFVANLLLTMMIGEINRTRKNGTLIFYVGFTFPKVLRVFSEYRASHPNGNLHIYTLVAFALAVASLIGVAVCLRIIG